MRRRGFWGPCYKISFAVQLAAAVLAVFVGAVLKADPAKVGGLLGDVFHLVQDSAWWLVVAIGTAGLLAKLACAWIGPPWVWDTVQRMLDRYREEAFEIVAGEPVHEHRVTIFKHSWWLWRGWRIRSSSPWHWRVPWSGWLAPVARSGHTTQQSAAVFLVPDDADNVEGVAGQTWACNSVVHVKDLPDLANHADHEQIAEYAKKTWVSEEWVKRRIKDHKSLSRELLGIPLEVNKRRWGVIILDCRRPGAIRKSAHSWPTWTKLVPFFLEELLRRA